MKEFVLYTYNFVSRAERVLWCLKELDLEYSVIQLNPMKGDIFTPEFQALNPMRKVPVLVHNKPSGEKKVLSESLAIMEYLNHYAKGDLKPKTLDELYEYEKVKQFGVTELEAYLWVANQSTLLRGIYHWPECSEKEAIKQVKRAMPEVFKSLSRQKYITGNSFTLMDIFYHQLLNWAKSYNIELPSYVLNYLTSLEQRPAYPMQVN